LVDHFQTFLAVGDTEGLMEERESCPDS